MNKNDLDVLAEQTAGIARQLISSEIKDDLILLINRYNSSLAQYIQILETFPPNMRPEISSATMLAELHNELEEALLKKKAGLKEMIINLNGGMSLNNKYYGKSIHRAGLDKKG